MTPCALTVEMVISVADETVPPLAMPGSLASATVNVVVPLVALAIVHTVFTLTVVDAAENPERATACPLESLWLDAVVTVRTFAVHDAEALNGEDSVPVASVTAAMVAGAAPQLAARLHEKTPVTAFGW